MKKFTRLFISLFILTQVTFGFVPTAFATAGAPNIISYQGRLKDSSGNLLGGSSGTTYYFKYSIWDNATVLSGSKLWPAGSPGVASSTVKNGVFSANIGDTANGFPDALTYNFNDNSDVYLQIEVSSDNVTYETLSPRRKISSAGFAINANTVGGFTPSETPSGSNIPVLSSGNLLLSGNNPQINATSTNALVFQGGATGDIMFFASSTKITSGGNLTLAGNLTVSASTTFGGVAYTWPNSSGSSGQFLSTSGDGALSWATVTPPPVSTSTAITANYFPFWSNTNGGLTGTSTIYSSGSSIGIGTATPSSTLHVVGTLQTTGTSTLANVNATAITASGALNASSTLSVTGATSLGSTLQVTGLASLLSTLNVSGAITSAGSGKFFQSFGVSRSTSDYTTGVGIWADSGQVGISMDDAAGAHNSGGWLVGGNVGRYGWAGSDFNFGAGRSVWLDGSEGRSFAGFPTFAAGAVAGSSGDSGFVKSAGTGGNLSTKYDGTEVQRFSSATNAAFGTNLVVGDIANTASTTLHVVGTFKATASSTFSSAGASKIAYLDASSTLTGINIGTGLTLSGDTLSASGAADGNDPFKWIANSTDLYASSTYTKVGIGTTAPSSTLHVVGTMTVTGTSTFSGPTTIDDLNLGSIGFEADSGVLNWVDMPVTSNSTAGTKMSYAANLDGNSMITIYGESDGSGGIYNKFVGIGTSAPSSTLHVVSTQTGTTTMAITTLAGQTANIQEWRSATSTVLAKVTANGGIVVGAPTGGDLGYGTINANAVYDDNSILTDYVFDMWQDGKLLAEDAELHADYNRLTMDEMFEFIKTERHLRGIAGREELKKGTRESVGRILQGVQQNVEEMATVLYGEVNDRLKALEKTVSAGDLQGNSNSVAQLDGNTDLTVKSLTINGELSVKGQVTFNKDTAGQAKILPGAMTVRVDFAQEYKTRPIVIVSTETAGEFRYFTPNISTTGFNIDLSQTASGEVVFNWIAIASADDAVMSVSDGSHALVNIVVDTAPVALLPLDRNPSPQAVPSLLERENDSETAAIQSAPEETTSGSPTSEGSLTSQDSPELAEASTTPEIAAEPAPAEEPIIPAPEPPVETPAPEEIVAPAVETALTE